MKDEQFKQIVWREIGGVVSAFGEPCRLEIIEIPSQCERNDGSFERLPGALAEREGEEVKVFFVGDAAARAQPNRSASWF